MSESINNAEQLFLTELDDKLQKTADRLRNNLDAANYKHVVLGLIFVKYVSDAFEERQNELRQLFINNAPQLSAEYGKGFDDRNLRNMRKFYQSFPNWNAVRTELSWTHYRALIRIGNEQARAWYMQETQSKYYHYAVSDLKKANDFAQTVSNWQGFATHDAFMQALQTQHARKSAFWSKLGESK